MQRTTRTGYLLTVTAAIVWAATSPGIKYLLETHHVPALAIAFWRDALMALTCFAAIGLVRPALLRVSRRDLRGLAAVGTISIGIYHALWVLSIVLNGASVAVVMIYTFPTFVTLGAWLLFGERIRWPQVLALAISLLGAALLARAYDPAVLRVSWLGTLVGLSTGLAHAGYVLYSQRSVQNISPWASLAYTTLFGSLALLVLWFVCGALGITDASQTRNIVAAVGTSAPPWVVLLILALGPTLMGYALFTMALRHIPGRVASIVVMLEAPVSVLLSVALLAERLERPQIAGMALILGATVLPRLLAADAPAAEAHAAPLPADG